MMTLFFLPLFLFIPLASADLRVGFYGPTCHRAESIVRTVVRKHFATDPSLTAAFLRMHFHDCFVTGCDASILIDSTKNNPSEKTTGPNLTVRGFKIIAEAKSKIEAQCPSTVSCADIIALATRDSVAMAGGPAYLVPTGRRDGLFSRASDVFLPGPSSTVEQARQVFASKGLLLEDMVILLGGHTVGVAHCRFFRDRLSTPDPTMDAGLRKKLMKVCGAGTSSQRDPKVFLDQKTKFVVDNQFYKQILAHKGVLKIDQELSSDNSTARIVRDLSNDRVGFLDKFGKAMVKLGRVQVLVGSAGEIRRNCSVFNQRNRGT